MPSVDMNQALSEAAKRRFGKQFGEAMEFSVPEGAQAPPYPIEYSHLDAAKYASLGKNPWYFKRDEPSWRYYNDPPVLNFLDWLEAGKPGMGEYFTPKAWSLGGGIKYPESARGEGIDAWRQLEAAKRLLRTRRAAGNSDDPRWRSLTDEEARRTVG